MDCLTVIMYTRLLLFEVIRQVICAHKIYICTVYNNRIAPLDQRRRNVTGEGGGGTYGEEPKCLQDIIDKT